MRIAVFNQKGGVGKTTTTINLAAALARQEVRCLMVDLDPQGHLTSIVHPQGVESRASVFSLYQHNRPLAEIMTPWPSLGHLIPAHAELIKVDSLFGKGPSILNRLKGGLNDLVSAQTSSSRIQATLIDCCPYLGVLSLNALFAADGLLIPVSSDHLSMRGALQIQRTLDALEPVWKRRLERRYVLTRFDRRRKMGLEIATKMRNLFGSDLCETVISENVAVAEAPALGLDIFAHAASSRGAADHTALLDELHSSGFLSISA